MPHQGGFGQTAGRVSFAGPSVAGGAVSQPGIFEGIGDFFNDAFSLEGRKDTLRQLAGVGGAITSLTEGLIRASGERARARTLRVRASQIRVEGGFAVTAAEEEGRRVIGAQRAVRGFQGVTMSGSSLDVLAETAQDAAWNTMVIAYNYETAEAAALYSARLAKFNAKQATLQGISGALGSLAQGFFQP